MVKKKVQENKENLPVRKPLSLSLDSLKLPTEEESKMLFHDSKECPIQFGNTKDENGKNALETWCEGGTKQFADDLRKIVGVSDYALATDIFLKGINAVGGNQGAACNLVLQALHDFKPSNALEANLCVQATALHSKGMKYLQRAENYLKQMNECDMLQRVALDEAHNREMKYALKLLQLHNETVDIIIRTKRGNEQKVTVQHQYVQVNEGGKAIVGQFDKPGGGVNTKMEASHGL